MQTSTNINTPEYWNGVYREEWESGQARGDHYHRDYGPIHEAILRLILAGSKVLDVACGAGVLCRKIARQVAATHVTGVDFSEYMLERNRQRDRALAVQYQCLDVTTCLLSLGRQFDVVCMCEVLEHLSRPEKVLQEAITLLKPGGRFVLTCPHDNCIPDPEHLRIWGHDELFHLLAPYTDTVSFMHFPPPHFHVWVLAYFTKRQANLY